MYRKIIRFLTVTIAILCVLSVYVSAEMSVISSVDEDDRVTVTVSSDLSEEQIFTVLVFEPGFNKTTDVSSGSANKVYKMETLNGIGKVEFSFDVEATDARGKYYVYADSLAEDAAETFFVIAEDGLKSTAFTDINNANLTTAEGILNQYNERVWIVDLQNSVYISDKTNILKSFVNLCAGSCKSAADVEKAFRHACALSEIQNATKENLVSLLNKFKAELGLTVSTEIMLDDAKINTAYEYLAKCKETNPVNSVSELETLLKRAEALGMINSASRADMELRIEKYADVLGISLTDGYDIVDKYELIKELVTGDKGDYKSLEEFQTKFNNTVKKLKTASQQPIQIRGGGTPSGGKGSGGSVGISASHSVTNPGELLGTISETKVFTDVEQGHWAKNYIEYVSQKSIMNGDGDGSFRPHDYITREEFLKATLTAFDITMGEMVPDNKSFFEDVPKDAWFYDCVRKATAFGVINGIDDNVFGTGTFITRQDAVVILMRVKERCKLTFADKNTAVQFSDQGVIADYALDAVVKMQTAGIVNGYENGEFKPTGNINRAEVAKIIYSMLSNINAL